jgi:15-hydroxyprostaglandin dehydrogenase (NAD)
MKNSGVALVTSAAAGMGLEVARKLCLDGWKVVAVDRDVEQGKKAALELGPLSTFIQADVTKYEDQLAAFECAEALYGSIDFVFANAGILGKADFYNHVEQWPPKAPSLAVQDVCLTGVIYTCHLAMQFMRRNSPPGGIIIITASGTFDMVFHDSIILILIDVPSLFALCHTRSSAIRVLEARRPRFNEVYECKVIQRKHPCQLYPARRDQNIAAP